MTILLNCDLGESYGSWSMGLDEKVMPYIDQANIACGFHAGDPLTIKKTLKLAGKHQVAITAHPSYPDLVGFGRRSMNLSKEELHSTIQYQIAALDGMARSQNLSVSSVKPHGALYNDMMRDEVIRKTVMQSVSEYHRPLKLVLLGSADNGAYLREAEKEDLELMFEAFADRAYSDLGKLVPRNESGAVHTQEKMLDQVRQLCKDGTVTTANNIVLPLQCDTLCVHGDNQTAVGSIRDIRKIVSGD